MDEYSRLTKKVSSRREKKQKKGAADPKGKPLATSLTKRKGKELGEKNQKKKNLEQKKPTHPPRRKKKK